MARYLIKLENISFKEYYGERFEKSVKFIFSERFNFKLDDKIIKGLNNIINSKLVYKS